jgi:hypothetical protein
MAQTVSKIFILVNATRVTSGNSNTETSYHSSIAFLFQPKPFVNAAKSRRPAAGSLLQLQEQNFAEDGRLHGEIMLP